MKNISWMLAPDKTGVAVATCLPRRRSRFSCLIFFMSFMAGILLWGAGFGQSAFGAPPAAGPAASVATISGMNAEVNGARMTSGATLFPGDVIQLGAGSSAALQFGKSLVLAAPVTEFVVEPEGVALRSGRLQVRASGEDSFAVSGPFFRVKIAASGNAPGSAEIQVGGAHARVSAVTGIADVTAADSDIPYELRPGETATLDAATAGAQAGQAVASPEAGQLSRLLPQVQIDRSSQHLVAAISDRVYWNDDLRSGSTGRARIALKDGSVLSLGSNSDLRVLQHDAQAQQTSLDLAIGRMRGQVVKLTRPGAKFEIRTPVGAAGLVGTDFSLLVTPDSTELDVFEGTVRFTKFSDGQVFTVTAGMKLVISRAGAVEGPSPATPQEIQTAKNLTDVPEGTGQTVSQNRKKVPLAPILVSVGTSGATLGISFYLDVSQRPPVSPSAPVSSSPGNVD